MNKTMRSPSHLIELSRDVKSGKVQRLIDNEGYTISDLMLTYDVSRNVIRSYSSNGDLVFPKHTGIRRRVFDDQQAPMSDAKRLALGSWKAQDIGTSTIDISSDDEEDKAMEQTTLDFDKQETETYLAFGTKIKPTDKPQTCPCCDQTVKLYKRTINSTTAYDLIHFEKRVADGEYMHIKHINTSAAGGGDFAKLRLWGLIEEKFNESTGKRSSGYWRITQKGRDFVNAKVMVRKYALIYNGKFLGFDGGMVTIKDSLGKHFDYAELMSR